MTSWVTAHIFNSKLILYHVISLVKVQIEALQMTKNQFFPNISKNKHFEAYVAS